MAEHQPARNVPPLKDLTIQNITKNVHLINSGCDNVRLRYLLERAVVHLHDFARETRLSANEWMTSILFLTAVGQICSDTRQEFILLSDVLGLSLLVDSIDHPKPLKSTEGTVLGPFHTANAETTSSGDTISHDPDGEPCLVVCTVKDTEGNPIPDVTIDVWETDSKGFYDVQYPERSTPDGRAILTSDANGKFWFKAIVPVPYPIPHDDPVGKLLKVLKRHPYRPSHMHFMFKKHGYDNLITALYLRGDPYETSDAVFGVKDSLVVDLKELSEEQMQEYGCYGTKKLIVYDFVLVSEEEAMSLRQARAEESMKDAEEGRTFKIVDGLPVPDVD